MLSVLNLDVEVLDSSKFKLNFALFFRKKKF